MIVSKPIYVFNRNLEAGIEVQSLNSVRAANRRVPADPRQDGGHVRGHGGLPRLHLRHGQGGRQGGTRFNTEFG